MAVTCGPPGFILSFWERAVRKWRRKPPAPGPGGCSSPPQSYFQLHNLPQTFKKLSHGSMLFLLVKEGSLEQLIQENKTRYEYLTKKDALEGVFLGKCIVFCKPVDTTVCMCRCTWVSPGNGAGVGTRASPLVLSPATCPVCLFPLGGCACGG